MIFTNFLLCISILHGFTWFVDIFKTTLRLLLLPHNEGSESPWPLDMWSNTWTVGNYVYIIWGQFVTKMRYLVIFVWYHYFLLDNQAKRWIVSRYTAGVSSIFSKIIYIIYDVFHKKWELFRLQHWVPGILEQRLQVHSTQGGEFFPCMMTIINFELCWYNWT